MITLGHKHRLTVLHRQRCIKRAIVRVHALNGKSLRGIHPVVIRLLQQSFLRQGVLVMFVRGIAGPYFSGLENSPFLIMVSSFYNQYCTIIFLYWMGLSRKNLKEE